MIKPYLKVETLAQLGVVFILLALGVELSISKLRRVQVCKAALPLFKVLHKRRKQSWW